MIPDSKKIESFQHDNAYAFQDEGTMWHEGYSLVLELRRLRGLSHELLPQPEEAERALNHFCYRLRQSDRDMSLPRIQREARLSNEHIAAVLCVMASCWVGRIPTAINQIAVTACGFSPMRLHTFVDAVLSGRGLGVWLVSLNGSLGPSAKLIALLSASLSIENVMALREELKRLPSADRATIPDNNYRPDREEA